MGILETQISQDASPRLALHAAAYRPGRSSQEDVGADVAPVGPTVQEVRCYGAPEHQALLEEQHKGQLALVEESRLDVCQDVSALARHHSCIAKEGCTHRLERTIA